MPAKRAPLTPEEIIQIVDLYTNGETVRGIASSFHTRTDTVTSALIGQGVEIRTGRAKLTEDEEQVVVHRHLAGESSASVGRALGITAGTVTRILRRHGVSVPTGRPAGKGWSEKTQSQILSLYSSGLGQQQVADELGISQPVVSRVLRRNGVVNQRVTSYAPENHGRWRGGRVIDSHGYVLVTPTEEDLQYCEPKANGYAPEHRLVMGRLLGRPVRLDESVHHKDGNRQNNDPSNLQLRQGNHGKGAAFTCLDCGSHNIQAVELG